MNKQIKEMFGESQQAWNEIQEETAEAFEEMHIVIGVLVFLLLPEFLPIWAFNILVIILILAVGVYAGAYLAKKLKELKL